MARGGDVSMVGASGYRGKAVGSTARTRSRMQPSTDLVLGHRYRLIDQIALGGMGEVWAAEDEVLGRAVAVKMLRPELVEAPGFRQRLRAEARHAAGLAHAGIANVYDYAE